MQIDELISSISDFFTNSVEISQNIDIFSLNTAFFNIKKWLGYFLLFIFYKYFLLGENNGTSFINNLVYKAQDLFLEEENFDFFEEKEIYETCSTIRDMFHQKLNSQYIILKFWRDLNISDLRNILKSCSSRIDTECQKALLETNANWDPALPIILTSLLKADEC